MPLHNWIKCNEGETEFIRKENIKDEGIDEIKWMEIYDQYIDKYGLSDVYIRLLKVMQKKALIELEFVKTNERFKLTEIEVQETKLKSMLANNGNGMSIDESLVHLSKWCGYRLNQMEISVVEYFNILKQYGKANKSK
jgi:hypothetical protein